MSINEGRLFLATGGGAIVGTELDPETQTTGSGMMRAGSTGRLLARSPIDKEAEERHALDEAA